MEEMICCSGVATVHGTTVRKMAGFAARNASGWNSKMMIFVSGATKTIRRLAPLWKDYLGILKTPNGGNSIDAIQASGLRWSIDNGAFSGFDPESFRRLLRAAAGRPLLQWIVCPDVVGRPAETLQEFERWQPEVAATGPVAFVSQDGQDTLEVPWDRFACFFIGGSTEWKLSHANADLTAEAKRRGKWVHMGRVNSRKRMELANEIGCDSIDGTSVSMFGDTHLPRFLRQLQAIEASPLLFR